MIVTNDAYWFLLAGEEPLDEDNTTEILSLAHQLESLPSYEISATKFLPGGKVEIELLPNIRFTHYLELTKYVRIELCYGKLHTENEGLVFFRFHNIQTNQCWGHAWRPIELNSKGKAQAVLGTSVIPLWTNAVKEL